MKILILDDDKNYCKLVSEYMKQCGIENVATSSVVEAREILSTQTIDKCVVDVLMPEENGIDFIRTFKNSSTKFYIMTGDLEHPQVINRLNDKSLLFSGIVIKKDLIQGLREIANGHYQTVS